MSQTFTDEQLLTWEAFASGGKYGQAIRPKLVFQCLSDPSRRARVLEIPGDEATAESVVHGSDVARLRELLAQARDLD